MWLIAHRTSSLGITSSVRLENVLFFFSSSCSHPVWLFSPPPTTPRHISEALQDHLLLILPLTENITFLCFTVKLYKIPLRLHPITLTMIRANGVYQLVMSSYSPPNKERQRDVDSEPASTFANEDAVSPHLQSITRYFSPLYGIQAAISALRQTGLQQVYCRERIL